MSPKTSGLQARGLCVCCKHRYFSYIIGSMEHGVFAPNRVVGQNTDDSRPDAFDSLFERIVNSETFRSAPVMRELLLYLWRHQGESVSEYAIAIDALGRPPDFDPKIDATVRVGIARLRRKLKEQHEREMASSPFQLTIPLGGHEIRWIQCPNAPSRLAIMRDLPRPYRSFLLGSIAVGVVLGALCIILVLQNHRLKASLPIPQPQPRFWRTFLAGGSGKSPLIVVPSPIFFRWPDKGVLIRDVVVAQFQDWMTSRFIRQVAGKWGPPSLAQVYIPVEAVKGAAGISQYLESLGQHPALTDSPNLAADRAGAQNTIFLGSMRWYVAGDWVKQVLEKTNFYTQGADPTVVGNRSPRTGEAPEYREVDFSTDHKVVPELITLLPVRANGTRTLFLFGPNPTVFMSVLVSPDGLKLVDDQWKRAGSPESWEMVIQAETNGDTVLRLQPVAIRRIPASFWK
jgi:hypothetical protein